MAHSTVVKTPLVNLSTCLITFMYLRRRHYSGMMADSGLLRNLEQNAFLPDGQPTCIYGDPAYPLRIHHQAPFRAVRLTPDMEAFNKSMSNVRVSVEWIFGDIVNYFKFMDFKKILR